MAIEFSCTCGTRVKAPNDAIGKRAQCNHCGAVLTVPDPDDPRWPPGFKRPDNPQRVPDVPTATARPATQPPPAMPPARPSAFPARPAIPPTRSTASPATPVAAPVASAPVARPAAPVARPAAPVAAPVASPANIAHALIQPPADGFDPIPVDDIDSLLAPADFAPISTPMPERIEIKDLNPYGSHRDEEPDTQSGLGSDASADLTTTEWTLAILCSTIGAIMGFVFLIQGKPKAAKMIGVSFASGILWGVILQMITQAVRLNSMGP